MNQYNDEPAPSTLPAGVLYGAAAVALALLIAIGFYLFSDRTAETVEAPAAPAVASPAADPQAAAVEPAPPEPTVAEPTFAEQAEAEPEPEVVLPPLNNSDAEVREVMASVAADLPQWLVPDELIRKFVLAVNNTSGGELARKYPPIVPPRQAFVATRVAPQRYTLPRASYRRYDPYTRLLAAIDMQMVARLYRQYYPLLQEAHQELGQSKNSFHATLLKAIDHLLTAPVIEDELPLVRTSVLYKYADADLEKLPDTHKLLLRMGPDNTRQLKTALGELKAALAQ